MLVFRQWCAVGGPQRNTTKDGFGLPDRTIIKRVAKQGTAEYVKEIEEHPASRSNCNLPSYRASSCVDAQLISREENISTDPPLKAIATKLPPSSARG